MRPGSPRRARLRLGRAAAVAIALAATWMEAAPSSADEPALATLFPFAAAVRVDDAATGLAALELPPEVLARCRPDLSDLRLFAVDGRELPYLVDAGSDGVPRLEERRVPELLGVERRELRREEGPPLFRETYRLAAPPPPAAGEGWNLVAAPGGGGVFVSRVEVSAIDGAGAERPLVPDGSIYRLADPPRQRLHLVLPPLPEGTARLVVTLETEAEGYLSPRLAYTSGRDLDGRRRTELPLAEVGRRVEAGQTVVELLRPRGVVPESLRLATTTPGFRRRVTVWDEGPGRSETALGTATLLRVPGRGPVEETEVAVTAAQGDRLRVAIDDGDSPPLDELGFVAVLRAPTLVFAPPPGGTGGEVATMRFGGGRAHRPRYDLQGLLPVERAVDVAAEAAAAILESRHLTTATLGDIVANPRFDPAPALDFALRPGAVVDARLFSHQRELEVAVAPEGLVRLSLELADLAVARPDLGDLRVVDAESRQWAFLLEAPAALPRRELDVVGPERDGEGRSRYRLRPPATPATAGGLVLDTPLPFFDRPFRLLAVDRDGQESLLVAGRLIRRRGDPRAIELRFAPRRLEEMILEVTDGDDAPIAPLLAHGLFPLPELFAAVTPGTYRLLLGSPELTAPSYELGRVRDVVHAVESAPVAPGPLEENPAFRRGLRWSSESALQRILLWAVLLAAVVGLAVLTLRLARGDGASPS